MEKKPKVLFLSTGNSTRSQMAEGFLRHLAGEHFVAVSAGIEPGGLNPMAVQVMKEAGIDISHQVAKDVTESLREHFGYVITVSDSAKERSPIFPTTTNLLHWSLIDPGVTRGPENDPSEVFRKVRDEIRTHVQEFVSREIPKRKAMARGA